MSAAAALPGPMQATLAVRRAGRRRPLLCGDADAQRLALRWATHVDGSYRPADEGRFRSRFLRFGHLPMPVEAMGALQVGDGITWQSLRIHATASVATAAGTVRIPTPAEQLRVLRLFGRDKDLDKARRLLSHLSQESIDVG